MNQRQYRTKDFIATYGSQIYETIDGFVSERTFTNIVSKIGSYSILLMFDSIYISYETGYSDTGVKFTIIKEFGRNIDLPESSEYDACRREMKINRLLY
jgi:hypothetical protein